MNEQIHTLYQDAKYSEIIKKIAKNTLEYLDEKSYYALCYSYFYVWDFQCLEKLIYKGYEKFWKNTSITEIEALYYVYIWRYNEAFPLILSLRNIWYSSASLSVIASTFLQKTWDILAAKQLLIHSLQEYPWSAAIYYNLWNISYVEWHYKEALEYYTLSHGIHEYLYAACKKIRVLKLLWRTEESQWFAQQLLDHKYISGYKNNTSPWDVHLIAGNIFLELWEYKKAISCYEQHLNNCKKDIHSLDSLWDCYEKIWDIEKSQYYFELSLSVNPHGVYPKNGLIKLYLKTKDIVKAEALCKENIDMEPSNFLSYYLLWRCKYYQQEYTKAYEYFQESAKRNQQYHMNIRYMNKVKKKIWIN